MIVKCLCPSKWQDERYGSQMRVANRMKSTSGPRVRCTVCGKEVIGASDKSQKGNK